MNILNKIKCRVQAYIEYIFSLHLLRQRYYMEAERLTEKALHTTESGVSHTNTLQGEGQLIVSLTTYDKRYQEVFLAIESIMQQTVKPDRIILWLADNMKDIPIPVTLQKQMKRGLEIEYCDDIRSFKKLIPTLKKYPDDVIVTIDDDVLYNFDVLENLVNIHKKHPNCVIGTKGQRMRREANGKLTPYVSWPDAGIVEKPSVMLFPVGCGGILYPAHILDDEVLNKEVFMSICQHGDDIWFKAMALKAGHKTVIVRNDTHANQYHDNPQWQDKGLTQIDINAGYNDTQIEAVFSKYDLYNVLGED